MFELLSQYDAETQAAKTNRNVYRWPFVYLHGKAEDIMGQHLCNIQHAPDLFYCLEPHPKQTGEYPCMLYGEPALAVIQYDHGFPNGRIALLNDPVGLTHAKSPNDWR